MLQLAWAGEGILRLLLQRACPPGPSWLQLCLSPIQGVLLERNVAADVLGHAFFIEDGAEFNNTMRGNLGLLVSAAQLLCPCFMHSAFAGGLPGCLPLLTRSSRCASPPQVRPKTTGARLGSDKVGANGDLSVFW